MLHAGWSRRGWRLVQRTSHEGISVVARESCHNMTRSTNLNFQSPNSATASFKTSIPHPSPAFTSHQSPPSAHSRGSKRSFVGGQEEFIVWENGSIGVVCAGSFVRCWAYLLPLVAVDLSPKHTHPQSVCVLVWGNWGQCRSLAQLHRHASFVGWLNTN